jgi:hypothetical protein
VLRRWGMPPPTAYRRSARHQYSEYVVAAPAGLAQAGEPLPGPRKWLCGVRAGAEPRD